MSFLGWQGGHWTRCGFLLVWAGEWGLEPAKNALSAALLPLSLLQNCHGIQPFLDSSNVAPSLRLQLSKNCSSVGPFTAHSPSGADWFPCFHCGSWQTGFNDSHTPSEDEFTLLILKDSSSWHSISYRHAVSWWTSRNSLSGVCYSTNMTLYILQMGEFDQRRSWSWALQHSRTPTLRLKTRLQHCQLLCYFLPVRSDKSPIW